MTREQFKWGAFVAIILALTYVPTERCHYIGIGKRCAASKWQFFFDVSGLSQVDTDRLIIQIVVVVVAIVGLWLLVVRDKLPANRGVKESAEARDARSFAGYSTLSPSVPAARAEGWGARNALQDAKVFEAKKTREPFWLRMLGGAILGGIILGGGGILFSIGLAIWTAVQGGDGIGVGGYVFFVGFTAIVGGFFGALGGIFSK